MNPKFKKVVARSFQGILVVAVLLVLGVFAIRSIVSVVEKDRVHEVQTARLAIDQNVQNLTILLQTPQNEWGAAKNDAWRRAMDVLSKNLVVYENCVHENELRAFPINREEWPLEVRMAIQPSPY